MRSEHLPTPDSGNSTVWEIYIDIAFVVVNSFILLVTSVVGIAANVFVILAVCNQKSLQTWNNALVVNLAVIDILRCVVDSPILFTIILTVHQRGRVNELICDTQVASFSFSCCIQLLTLACISAERYQAIAQPFKTPKQRRRRILVLIPLTWTLAILVAGFCLIFVKDSPVHVKCRGSLEETSTYDTFGLYMLLPLWAACFGVIIGFYASIFFLVRSHNRKVFDKGVFLPKQEKTEDQQRKEATTAVENGHEQSQQTKTLSVGVAQEEQVARVEADSSKKDSAAARLNSIDSENKKQVKITGAITELGTNPEPPAVHVAVQSSKNALEAEQSTRKCAAKVEAKPPHGDASVTSSTKKPQTVSGTEKQSKDRVRIDKVASEMKETNPHVPASAQLDNPESTSVLLIEPKHATNSSGGETLAVATVDQVPSLPAVSIDGVEAAKPNMETEGAVCMMPSRASKGAANKKKESKMAKRAGYIIITFLLFWLPLIATILVNFLVHKNKITQITIVQELEILSVSIACITSLSDPIIYAAVNPQFRSEFYRLKNKIKSTFIKEL